MSEQVKLVALRDLRGASVFVNPAQITEMSASSREKDVTYIHVSGSGDTLVKARMPIAEVLEQLRRVGVEIVEMEDVPLTIPADPPKPEDFKTVRR